MPLQRPSAGRRWLRAALTAGWILCAITAGAGGLHAQGGKHGDATAAVQLARLDQLMKGTDPLSSPASIDSEIWKSAIPTGEETTPARFELGRKLYFDVRLSADDSVSCATCHDVTRGFTDQRPVSEGIEGKNGRRNAPTTLNAALIRPMFWDGRARNLSHQAGMPVLNPIEMGSAGEDAVITKLKGIAEYPGLFQQAFGRQPNYEDMRRAIAIFERSLVFLDAPFDRWLKGDESAISADAKEGWRLFNGQGRCVACHPLSLGNPLGTDLMFHNIGVAARNRDFETLARQALKSLDQDSSEKALDRLALNTDLSELGRFMITRQRSDIGSFRTPQIRSIGITGPYMHDGSMQTLWDVIDHYNKGGEDNAFLDGGIEALALDERQVGQLVEFLFTLTDYRLLDQQKPAYEFQKQRAASVRPFRDDALANRKKLGFEDRVIHKGADR